MKKILFTLCTLFFIVSIIKAEDNSYTGDVKLACEMLLCLPSNTWTGGCKESQEKFHSIHGRNFKKTLKKRINFIKQCPQATSVDVDKIANDSSNRKKDISNNNALDEIISKCSFKIHPNTMKAMIKTESSFNPYAIAVVSGAKQPKQPNNFEDAVKIINALEALGANYSVGLAQINKSNFKKYKVTGVELLDSCKNLQVSQEILTNCYKKSNNNTQKALSCYYSGNFTGGFVKDSHNNSYIDRIYKKVNYILPSIGGNVSKKSKNVSEVKNKSVMQRKLNSKLNYDDGE